MNKAWEKVVLVIAALGAIDLGLMTFGYEIVGAVGLTGITAQIIFAIIGLCGIWALVKIFK